MQERIELNDNLFSSAPALTRFKSGNQNKFPACTHSIESLATMSKLLDAIRLKNDKPILRFLVDTSLTLWFGRETRAGVKAPKHFQMTGAPQNSAYCSTAGDIEFTDSTCEVLKSINHKSGDFRPSFYSLRLFIAILILNEETLPFKLPDVLIIKEFDNTHRCELQHHWPILQIKDWVQTFVRNNEELVSQLSTQNATTKIVSYNSSTTRTASQLGDGIRSAARRLKFDDELPSVGTNNSFFSAGFDELPPEDELEELRPSI